MTTNLRRITISLPPAVDEAIREYADAYSVSHSRVVIAFLTEFAPTMRNLAKMQTQLKAGQLEDMKRTLQHTFGDAMAGLLQDHLTRGEKQ